MAHAVQPAAPPAEEGIGVYTQKLGMWVFLASEVMFFTALIGTYIILRWGSAESWPVPQDILNIPLTAFNTFVLICSSVSMVKAYAAATHDDQKGLRLWLVLTVLAGATFVGVQLLEYRHLIHDGFTLPSGNFPATFYVITSFHGAHVFTGVCYLLLTAFGVWRGKHLENGANFVEITGLFWHFVDLVWILVFTLVYLIP